MTATTLTNLPASAPHAPDGHVKLMLVDDHRMLRQTLSRSLEAEGFVTVAEANDGNEAIALASRHRPDVILMDVSMPGMGGVEATRQITALVPEARIIMLTMHSDQRVVSSAIEAGAVGYLVKDCSIADIGRVIRAVASGNVDLSASIAAGILGEASALERAGDGMLSAREIEVLQRIADGASTPEVAASMFISDKTVKNHLASIFAKLDARDRTQAVLAAVRMGVVSLS